jgi:hypothetical protein
MSRLGDAVQLSYDLEARLGRAFGELAQRHAADADVFHICSMFAEQCSSQVARLRPHAERLSGTEASTGPTIAGRVDRDEQGTDLLGGLDRRVPARAGVLDHRHGRPPGRACRPGRRAPPGHQLVSRGDLDSAALVRDSHQDDSAAGADDVLTPPPFFGIHISFDSVVSGRCAVSLTPLNPDSKGSGTSDA